MKYYGKNQDPKDLVTLEKVQSIAEEYSKVETVSINGGTPIEPDENKNIDIVIPEGGVTGVKGAAESTFRKGDVTLTAANIGALGANETAADSSKLGGVVADNYALKSELPEVDQNYDATSINAQSGTAVKQAVDGVLPAQSGQNGKFLTTDGTVASWANVDALPAQSGQSGKFLMTDGITASWNSVITYEEVE